MASDSSSECTPRLSEEAIPTHRSTDTPAENSKTNSNSNSKMENSSSSGPSPTGRTGTANVSGSSLPNERARSPPKSSTKHPGPGPGDQSRSRVRSNTKPSDRSSAHQRPSSHQGKPATLDAIDVSDPDKLLQQLANVDLTDEETDLLLAEAYALNKKLRAELKRQEDEAKKRTPHRLPPLDQQSQARLQERTKLYGVPMQAASHPGHSRAKSTQSAGRNKPSQAQSVMADRRRQQRSPSGRNKSSPPKNREKPEWDDRFSYG